jgi:hypothetical protein
MAKMMMWWYKVELNDPYGDSMITDEGPGPMSVSQFQEQISAEEVRYRDYENEYARISSAAGLASVTGFGPTGGGQPLQITEVPVSTEKRDYGSTNPYETVGSIVGGAIKAVKLMEQLAPIAGALI